MSQLPYLRGPVFRTLRSYQVAVFMAADVCIIWVSTFMAYWTRFSGSVGAEFVDGILPLATLSTVLFVALFWVFRLYHQVWRHVGIDMLVRLASAVGLGSGVIFAFNLFYRHDGGLRLNPLGTIVILGAFVFLGCATLRAFARFLVYAQQQQSTTGSRDVIIVGAGDAGALLLRDIESRPGTGLHVVGFLDDDRGKTGRYIRSIPVLGTVNDLTEVIAAHPVTEVLVAIPSATTRQKAHVLDAAASAGLHVKMMQPITVDPDATNVDHLREVRIEDLLGRDPVQIDVAQVSSTLTGKRVMVTGGAGSIGSELARQIITMDPDVLLLVDIDESRLYETWLELRQIDERSPRMVICDIRDAAKVDRMFAAEKPEVILHAAAYKHVPLMELAPDEAVKANVLGTRNIIGACERFGAERFVLISTDKAVAPSSFMGCTKAIAERQMLSSARRGLKATAVRFGNVLGSRGSVVPIFEEQLRRGRPLSVTHPDITRYFMTIPEAARLVLQAQAIAAGCDIFVLEMGDPVKIVDLANKMIALSGVSTHVEFVGLRPAEKLHEILVHGEEDLMKTEREKVLRVNSLPLPSRDFESRITALIDAAVVDDRDLMVRCVLAVMPDFEHTRSTAGDATASVS